MAQEPPDVKEILERCIVENTDDAWAKFLATFGPLVRSVYHAHADAAGFREFEPWFPGWLYHERKLHAAYRALQAKVGSGECQTLASQQHYLANYLATIVRAAVAEFCQERRPLAARQVSDPARSGVCEVAASDAGDLLGRIRSILPYISPDLRIPFWLRYFQVFGPLSGEDAAWVAERSGLTAQQVAEAVAQEAEANSSHHKPLSSEFIGLLLNISPCGDGKYSTVDQRVRRAIVRIRELLAEEGDA